MMREVALKTAVAIERSRASAALRESEERFRTLQALISHLVLVQEDERRSLAREIHDGVGQSLTALRLHLEALDASCEPHTDAAGQVRRVQALADQLESCVAALTWDLRPAVLDRLGLLPALRTLLHGWSRQSGVLAEFYAIDVDDLRLAAQAEINLFRLAQEALKNVQRHAQATRVGMFLERRGPRLVLIVEDDGHGFDVAAATAQAGPGMGIVAMRQRAALIGGELEIESSAGLGTIVHVRVPCLGDACRHR